MQYNYRPITDAQGGLVSFAIDKDDATILWHMRNLYNGDLRTGSREGRLDIPLDQLDIKDLPPIVTKKLGKLSIGTIQTTPDISSDWDIGQHFRKLAGLPQIELKVKPHA